MTGKEIYRAILRDNGQSVDYLLVSENMDGNQSAQIKVARSSKWNWDDFRALVDYEKSENLSHEYSAMLAVRLMSGMIVNTAFGKLSAAEEKTLYNRKELFQTIQTNLWVMFATKRIESWDAAQGVYFSEYVKKDVLRIVNSTIDEAHISGLYGEFDFPVILSPMTGDITEQNEGWEHESSEISGYDKRLKRSIMYDEAGLLSCMEVPEQQEFSNLDFGCIELKPQLLQAVAFADLFLGGTEEWPSTLTQNFYASCMNMVEKKEPEEPEEPIFEN